MNISISSYYGILSRYLANQRLRFVGLCALVLSAIGLQIANPQIMRFFLDSTQKGAPMRVLLLAALGYLGAALLGQLLAVSGAYIGESVAWTATNSLREDLARHCLSLDMSFHRDKSPGELIERIEGDSTEFAGFFSTLVIRVVGNIVLLIGIIIAMFTVDWRLGAAFACFAAVALVALNATRNVAVPFQKSQRDAETDLFGFLEERLAGTEDIRSSGAVDYCLRKLYLLQSRIMHFWIRSSMMMVVIWTVAGFTMMGGISLAFLGGSFLFKHGLITMGTVYLIINYTTLIGRPIRELTHQMETLQKIGGVVERITELLAIKPTIADGYGKPLPKGDALSLEYKGVDFRYTEDKPVLEDITFDLKPGRIMGVLGRTGTGKTTMARLVFRLYDVNKGSIRLGGVDLKEATLKDLRSRVAYVTQDVQLFQATVRDNITFFDKDIPDSRILEVIEALGLMNWLESLPEGLETRLATGGRSLSGGEAQLLALTRVFLRDPGLVILDEASSRLDPATEQLVEHAIDRLLAGRTAVIIAHRLGTLHRADEILILEEGSVSEYGKRVELLSDPESKFTMLCRTGLEEMLA